MGNEHECVPSFANTRNSSRTFWLGRELTKTDSTRNSSRAWESDSNLNHSKTFRLETRVQIEFISSRNSCGLSMILLTFFLKKSSHKFVSTHCCAPESNRSCIIKAKVAAIDCLSLLQLNATTTFDILSIVGAAGRTCRHYVCSSFRIIPSKWSASVFGPQHDRTCLLTCNYSELLIFKLVCWFCCRQSFRSLCGVISRMK